MMINNYIYMFSNKWTHYKIKSLNKKISILKEEIDAFKVIENWISALALDLNDEISNYSHGFQLMNLKDIFLPKVLEDFYHLKNKKRWFSYSDKWKICKKN